MNKLEAYSKNIVEGEKKGVYVLSLAEFQELYKLVSRLSEQRDKKIGETYILLLTENALVRFSLAQKIIIQVSHNQTLSKTDFNIVISPKFEGNINPITWKAFIWTEFRQNWLIILFITVLFFLLFYMTNNFAGISKINELLIQSNSLFISIFILFTISQNRELLTNKELTRQGITHRLMQNDYYITSFAILSLSLALCSSAILTLPTNTMSSFALANSFYSMGTIAIGLTHLALILLLVCFLSVTKYYLKVMRAGMESKMYEQLMNEQEKENE